MSLLTEITATGNYTLGKGGLTIPLIKTLGVGTGVRVWRRSLAFLGLAALGVCINTALVLAVACIFASLSRPRLWIRWTFVSVSKGVKLEDIS